MKIVYADHNATGLLDEQHWAQVWERVGAGVVGNPSSQHQAGRNSHVLLSSARRMVAKTLEVPVETLIFLSGGSEANNIATAGVIWEKSHLIPIHNQHVVMSSIEHPSVREPIFFLKKHYNLQVTEVNPDENGIVLTSDVLKALKPETVLVAIMAANNETGAIQPVQEIGNAFHVLRWASQSEFLAHETHGLLHPELKPSHMQSIHFHVDAVQIFGKVPVSLWRSDGQDSIAICSHKIGGLTGIGALSLKRGFAVRPSVMGGPQERNRRAGTESLVGVVSFAILCEQMQTQQWWDQWNEVAQLKKWLYDRIFSHYPASQVKCNTPERSLPNTLSFCLRRSPDSSEDLLMELDMLGVYASSGSACSSGVRLPSHVLKAMGRTDHEVLNGIRFSLGRLSGLDDVEFIFQCLTKVLLMTD